MPLRPQDDIGVDEQIGCQDDTDTKAAAKAEDLERDNSDASNHQDGVFSPTMEMERFARFARATRIHNTRDHSKVRQEATRKEQTDSH